MTKIEIKTRDGVCPSYVFHPAGQGPWPAAILFMDGPGIRDSMFEMGERLAAGGYYVLLPDLFYRSGPYEPMNPGELFGSAENRKVWMETFVTPANPANIVSDTGYFLDWLQAQSDVKPGGVGITGYCMGGRLAFVVAAHYPERIAVLATFHGGNLVNDTPESPHLLAPKLATTKVYVAGAIEDAGYTDAHKARMEKALAEAGVDFESVTYPALHGWVPTDMPVYDAANAQRHWDTLIPLFDSVLK